MLRILSRKYSFYIINTLCTQSLQHLKKYNEFRVLFRGSRLGKEIDNHVSAAGVVLGRLSKPLCTPYDAGSNNRELKL